MLPAPIIAISINVFLLNWYQIRFLMFKLDGIPRHCACKRFFVIPKEIIFPPRCIAGDWLCNLLALESTSFHSSEVLPSQVLHFGAAWEIGRPFARNNDLWSAKRSCGLLE